MASQSINNSIVDQLSSVNFQNFPIVGQDITASGQTIAVDVRDASAAVIVAQPKPTVAGAVLQFEFSLDSTNGTDGNWQSITAARTNTVNTTETASTTIGGALTYGWLVNLGGVNWLRVRASAFTSGTLRVLIQRTVAPVTPLATGANSIQVMGGQAANNASTTANPMLISGIGLSNLPTANTSGNNTRLSATLQGALVVRLDSLGSDSVRGSLALTTTTAQALFAAGGAGICNYLTDIQAINTGASAVDLIVLDGATEIWRLTLPVNVPVTINGLRSPLRGTAATALNVNLSAAGTVRVNGQGHRAA